MKIYLNLDLLFALIVAVCLSLAASQDSSLNAISSFSEDEINKNDVGKVPLGKVPGNALAAAEAANLAANSDDDEDEDVTTKKEDMIDGGPNMFTVTGTDVGMTWEKLAFREKYQWKNPKAPCHKFKLQVPDEKAKNAQLTLCIFRPQLEFADDSELYIHHVEVPEVIQEQKELKVRGYVKGRKESEVYGKMIDTYFYGEVAVFDDETGADIVYVVEEIKLLTKLMRFNEKILRNIFYVMNKGIPPGSKKYNAVVTRGASLMNFMSSVNPSEFVRGSFLVFSTSHNSYITAGEPEMVVDDKGKVTFNAGADKIIIDTEGKGSVHLITGDERTYIFRPHGKTVVQDGNSVSTLQEHEGAVAVSAFTSETSYGCILPTSAFGITRKGGYLCKVCLASDKLFVKHYISKLHPRESTISHLSRLIDKVSWTFRSTDWNNDKKSDNIGLDYDPQIDLWTYNDIFDETLNNYQLDELFGTLYNKDYSDCCVAIIYTMKRFPGSTFAKSSTTEKSQPEGVCAVRTDGQSNNMILISAHSKDGTFTPMTERQLMYVTAQQLAKAFGAGTDGTGQDLCDQFSDKKGVTRHFLMWPDVMRDFSAEEMEPSSCSKRQVADTLSTCRSACFDIDKHPFCGNGIVEDGEECDCGSQHACTLQKCCFARDGRHPCQKTGIKCKTGTGTSSGSRTGGVAFSVCNYLVMSLILAAVTMLQPFTAFTITTTTTATPSRSRSRTSNRASRQMRN